MSSLAPPLPPPPVGTDPTERRAHAISQGALTVVGLGGLLLAGRAVGIHAPRCPFRALTGVPCPGCGMTRLADAVAHGHLATAIHADVAGVLLLVALAALAITHVVHVVVRKEPPPRWLHGLVVPGVLVGLVLIHWGTTIVTGGLPST